MNPLKYISYLIFIVGLCAIFTTLLWAIKKRAVHPYLHRGEYRLNSTGFFCTSKFGGSVCFALNGKLDSSDEGEVKLPSTDVAPRKVDDGGTTHNQANISEISTAQPPSTDLAPRNVKDNKISTAQLTTCFPNPCQNGGECYENRTGSYCECGYTGYKGAVCHTPKYPLSCTALQNRVRNGKRLVRTQIDLDGSGPLRPFPVACQFYNDIITTSLRHSHLDIGIVDGYQEPGSYYEKLQYDAEPLEIQTMVVRSFSCWQQLVYYCRNAKIFNSPGDPFRPMSWWVSAQNKSMDYWASAPPGSRKCMCGVSGTCIDPTKWCNCDADQSAWTVDAGYIREQENLPIHAVQFGDTGTPFDEKEGRLKIGPLHCLGDYFYDKILNFSNATVELPPFNLGTTGDIYLEFRTSAQDGVLFHASGPTDFIKLTIINGTVVEFQCVSANGLEFLFVKMPYRFNNTSWHTVRVERNIKVVQLVVDEMLIHEAPNTIRDTPYELTSNFVIGGTLDEREGYNGSIRMLMLNGRFIDIQTYK